MNVEKLQAELAHRIAALEAQATELLSDGLPERRRQAATVFHQLGQIFESQVNDPPRALGHYRKAYDADPRYVPAIYAARQLYGQTGNLQAAARLCDIEASAETDVKRKVLLLRELAAARGQMSDHEGAVAALRRASALASQNLEVTYELAMALLERARHATNPDLYGDDVCRAADLFVSMAQCVHHELAIAYVEAALDHVPGHDAALSLLETLSAESGRTQNLPMRWQGYVSANPHGRFANHALKRLAEAREQSGDAGEEMALRLGLAERGDGPSARRAAELAIEAGVFDLAIRALDAWASSSPAAERVEPMHRALELAVATDRGANELIERARDLQRLAPGSELAITTIGEALTSQARWQQLRDHWLQSARLRELSTQVRGACLRKAARVCEQELQDLDTAIGALRAVMVLAPTDASCIDALARLLRIAGRNTELIQLVERELAKADDPARQEDLRALLLEGTVEPLTAKNATKQELSAAKTKLNVGVDETARLPALITSRSWGEVEETTRRELLSSYAIAAEGEGDLEGTASALEEALLLSPADAELYERLAATYRALGEHHREFETLSRLASFLPPAGKSRVFVAMATLADAKLNMPARARELRRHADILVTPSSHERQGIADLISATEAPTEAPIEAAEAEAPTEAAEAEAPTGQHTFAAADAPLASASGPYLAVAGTVGANLIVNAAPVREVTTSQQGGVDSDFAEELPLSDEELLAADAQDESNPVGLETSASEQDVEVATEELVDLVHMAQGPDEIEELEDAELVLAAEIKPAAPIRTGSLTPKRPPPPPMARDTSKLS